MNNNADLAKLELRELIEGKLAIISDMQLRSKRLKERFKKTENREWLPSTIAAELSFQTTHLLNSMIRHINTEVPVTPSPGIDKGLEDEIADVIFNLMNLANLSGMDVEEVIKIALEENYDLFIQSQDLVLKTSNIVIQGGELWDAIFRKEGFKHMSKGEEENNKYIKTLFGGILICLIILTRDLNIEFMNGFDEMIVDSNASLDGMGIES